MKDLSVNQRY